MKHFLYALAFGITALPALADGAGQHELVMVEQAGCSWCARWDEEISHIYPKTEEGKRAPLRRVEFSTLPAGIEFVTRPVFTPTFVLVEDNKELGRIEGYAGDEFFWYVLKELLDENNVPGVADEGSPLIP